MLRKKYGVNGRDEDDDSAEKSSHSDAAPEAKLPPDQPILF
jgi:hypothetical protein